MTQTVKQAEYQRKYYQKNKKRILEYSKDYFQRPEIKERRRAYLAMRRDKDKAWNFVYKLKRNYGITFEEWTHRLTLQGNSCAICGTSDPGARGWHMDHCHKTGENRGVLCQHCNFLLGHAKDNPEVLRMAANYLEVLNDYDSNSFND